MSRLGWPEPWGYVWSIINNKLEVKWEIEINNNNINELENKTINEKRRNKICLIIGGVQYQMLVEIK